MHSKIAEALRLRYEPVAILWSDERPEGALGFKGCGGGCAMVLFAQVAAKWKTAAFDKDDFGCFGGGVGLGFGRQYENFPLGGVEAFKYFLSTGLKGQGRDDLADYDRPGVENVFVPIGAGCHQIGIYAFREAERERPG